MFFSTLFLILIGYVCGGQNWEEGYLLLFLSFKKELNTYIKSKKCCGVHWQRAEEL